MKPMILSDHAKEQCLRRHANEEEVTAAIQTAQWEAAKSGRRRARSTAPFGRPSPVTGRIYQSRTVEAIFVEEPERLVVVTVLVKYSNERVHQ